MQPPNTLTKLNISINQHNTNNKQTNSNQEAISSKQ